MDLCLLGRYDVRSALVVGQAVRAEDTVLQRRVDVVLLPRAGATAGQVLARVRERITDADHGLPHVLDLVVLGEDAVAVVMAGDDGAVARLVALASGATAADPPAPQAAASGPAPEVTARPPSPPRRPALLAGLAAAGAAVVVGLLVAGAPGAGPAGPPAAAPASTPAEARRSAAPAPAPRPVATAPRPDEELVLILSVVRDDPSAGPAAPRLLRLLRGLDAVTGDEQAALARRTRTFVRAESAAGRLRPDLARRLDVVLPRLGTRTG